MIYTKENFQKVYDKISEILFLGRSKNFTLEGIMAIINLLHNDLYIAMETTNPLKLEPYWFLNSYGKFYKDKRKKKNDSNR